MLVARLLRKGEVDRGGRREDRVGEFVVGEGLLRFMLFGKRFC